jgi:predicted dehydrogenase
MSNQVKPIRVLVLGCGNMGASHAIAYHTNPGFESRRTRIPGEIQGSIECQNGEQVSFIQRYG